MAGMGPPPKPAAQRRRKNSPIANTLKLPAEGRKGDPPAWPLSEASPTEVVMWEQLWRLPHAVAWEHLGHARAVAKYCRVELMAEAQFTAVLLAEARQLEDRLGLTPLAMLRLRWEIVEDEVKEQRAAKAAPSARKRLRAVD